MPLWKLNTAGFTMSVSGDMGMIADEPILLQMLSQLRGLHAQVPLASFKCQHLAGVPGVSGEYSYTLRSQDGRQWNQRLYVEYQGDVDDASMTFDVTDRWRVPEFAHQRDLRDATIQCILGYRVCKISCDWD